MLGPDKRPEPSDLPNLKYMELFIKETLRLYPIAGIIVRAVDEDIQLGKSFSIKIYHLGICG